MSVVPFPPMKRPLVAILQTARRYPDFLARLRIRDRLNGDDILAADRIEQ